MRPVARVTPSVSGADNNSYYNMNYQQNPGQGNAAMNNAGQYSYSGYSNVPYYQLQNSSSSNATSSDGTSYSNYYDYSNYSAATAAAAATNSVDYSAACNAYANYPYYTTDSTSTSYQFTYGDQSSSTGGSQGGKKSGGYQPWVKRDSLKRPAPYSGGKGMSLMQKMGWKQGQGLGRREDGAIEPSFPEIKMDKKGLDVSQKETAEIQVWMKPSQRKKPSIGTIKIVTEGKNPISILEEYCTKRKIGGPKYETAVDEGPIHAKHFVFKVTVEEVEYTADKGSNVKKEAKQLAAKKCLQELGILSKESSAE